MKLTRYYAKCAYHGETATLITKATSKQDARVKLKNTYKIDDILDISDKYIGERYVPSYYRTGVINKSQRNMRKTTGNLV